MKIFTTMTIGAIALAAGASASAQRNVEAAFSATGASCDQVTWSAESLRNYPNIANACQEVVQRDGKYYVRFEGEVRRVANRGQELTIDFRDGDTLTLEPPENMSLTMNGRRTAVRDLRPGDDLTFFVPQDQLAASFDEPATATTQLLVITPAPSELVAQNQPSQQPRTLPRTAGMLPLAGLLGLIALALGGALTLRRKLQ